MPNKPSQGPKHPPGRRELLSTAELAAMLHLGEYQTRFLARAGIVPGAYRPPGTNRWLFDAAVIDAWIESGASRTPPPVPVARKRGKPSPGRPRKLPTPPASVDTGVSA